MSVMGSDRVRIGVSIASSTRDLLDELETSGAASSRSAAIDVLADAWRRHRIDVELIAAARGVDAATEADLPGVVGGDPDGGSWPSASS